MNQLTLVSALDATLASVVSNNMTWIDLARQEATKKSRERGSVTSDDIRLWADRTGYQPDSPHAYGAIFKCAGWVMVGRQRSTYGSNNGRYICRWQYQPAPRRAP